ncbi:MAG: HAD-IA family hydrolase [Elainellaceae cyanobacterium]
MVNFPSITHVIFDLDGLLLDTEPLIFAIVRAIAAHYGKTVDDSIRVKTAGRNALDSAEIVIKTLDLPITPSDYLQHKQALIEQIYPRAQPKPGAVRLVQHLHRHSIPTAIATSTSQQPFRLKITQHQDWFDGFDCIVMGDDPDVHAGKPAPDIFLLAAQRLGARPTQCLVFEDSLAGIAAARAANMTVVAVPEPIMDASQFYAAHQVIPSLLAFEPQAWGLPLFSSGTIC